MNLMTVHNNVYIPKESWPYWTWSTIEIFIVFAAALMISKEIMTVFHDMALGPVIENWIYWSIVGVIFFLWYIVIRGITLKKSVLGNSVNY